MAYRPGRYRATTRSRATPSALEAPARHWTPGPRWGRISSHTWAAGTGTGGEVPLVTDAETANCWPTRTVVGAWTWTAGPGPAGGADGLPPVPVSSATRGRMLHVG